MLKRLKTFFTENLAIKLLSVGFAIVLWVFVSLGQTESELPKKVRVELKNLPADLVRSSDIPAEIEIKVSGTHTVLRDIDDGELRYVLDLKGARAGRRIYKIYTPRIEGIPGGATITEITPTQIELQLSERVNKTVRVNPILRGKPIEGKEVLGRTVVPEFVEVTGAREEIEILNTVDTEIIDIEGRKDSFSLRVGLDLIGRHVELAQKQDVLINVYIGAPQVKRMFPGVPIEVINAQYKYSVERERLDVQLEGSQEELTRINPEDLKLVLDAAALEPGLHTVELTLVLPEGMRFRNIERPRVKITVTNRKILKKN
ncbi:MAG TPA: CdaR family protein [bacterium]|nr:CdaR family protein [bacterium]